MAEVLRAHTRRPGTRDLAIHCECGWRESILNMKSSKGSFAAHQADALASAGFGPPPSGSAPEVRHATLINGETELDEVIATNATVHLEAMDTNHWWLLVESGGKSVHVNFYTKRAKISGHAEIEDAEP